MALTTTINFDFIDEKGKTSHTRLNVPLGFSLAAYREFAQDAAQILLNASACILTGVSISVAVDVSAVTKALAAVNSNVAAKIKGLFSTASGIIAKFLIPGPNENYTLAGSNDFDQTDPDVAALVSAYEDGIAVTGGTFTPTNGRGHDVSAVAELTQSFRRRKPG